MILSATLSVTICPKPFYGFHPHLEKIRENLDGSKNETNYMTIQCFVTGKYKEGAESSYFYTSKCIVLNILEKIHRLRIEKYLLSFSKSSA